MRMAMGATHTCNYYTSAMPLNIKPIVCFAINKIRDMLTMSRELYKQSFKSLF